MLLLYNILLTLLAPVWAPIVYLRARRRKEQPNWSQRLGNTGLHYEKGMRRIWIHAVSVGEVVAALPILRALRTRLPSHEIVLSVTTSSGHQTARERTEGLVDHVIYFPLDVARFQLAAMTQVRPEVTAIMETELWMNFVWASYSMRSETMLINGRISDRSYPRSMRIRPFYAALLAFVDRCLMQSKLDAGRIASLGAKDVEVFGNCKFDEKIDGLDADPDAWRRELKLSSEMPVIVVGSTRGPEEESFVLEALATVGFCNIQVVHAPRHLERAESLADEARQAGALVGMRSKGEAAPYLILDTYGELAAVYSTADIVIVGGGFEPLGGQNIIQPMAQGKPVLFGQHMQNFRDSAAMALESGAGYSCTSPQQLADAISELLAQPQKRREMGMAAARLVALNKGASERYADAIAEAAERVYQAAEKRRARQRAKLSG